MRTALRGLFRRFLTRPLFFKQEAERLAQGMRQIHKHTHYSKNTNIAEKPGRLSLLAGAARERNKDNA